MKAVRIRGRRAALALCVLLGCSSEPAARDAAVRSDASTADAQSRLLDGVARPGFCARPRADAVRDAFCAGSTPAITSLQELLAALSIDPTANVLPDPLHLDRYSVERYVPSAILAHSTALSGRLVSPINPRVILVGRQTVAAYQRGAQRVELAARERDDGSLAFYLVSFQQACNATAAGCSPGDLYTPRVESNWNDVTLEDDEDLKNTAFDCRQCHQRNRSEPILLMRELESPWVHFFEPATNVVPPERMPETRGVEFTHEYLDAKGDETYAGAPYTSLTTSAGLVLQAAVAVEQPLLFDSRTIQGERWPYGPEGYVTEPLPSPTWTRAYAAFKRGEQLALPYFGARATDVEKQAQLTEAYASYRAGTLSADELPDLANIFPDDPHERALIGLQTEPDATPAEALIQACGSCHNDVLDQTISRARFNIRLADLDRRELDLAIERISRAPGEPGVMPPPDARQLDEAAREALMVFLQEPTPSADDEALLDNAARLGMAGDVNAP